MTGLYSVEIEPEARSWLEKLTDRDFGRADFLVGLSVPGISASLTRGTSAGRSANCASICSASKPGSPTGWHPASA